MSNKKSNKLTLVAFSDTHGHHKNLVLPDGDVLIFAGDLMTCGRRMSEIKSFGEWFSRQTHKYKILVAGNHDRYFEHSIGLSLSQFSKDVVYLQDASWVINGFKFWGSPYQPEFCNWAFNVPRGTPIKEHWDRISSDTDVLITHGPPYGILDQMNPQWSTGKSYSEHLGCEELRKTVDSISPKVHIFGHIHGSYGHDKSLDCYSPKITNFYNVSICNEDYNPCNSPTVINIEK